MITTTYKCDRCGHEQDTETQMWAVQLRVQHLPIPNNWCPSSYYPPNRTPIWCRKCCEAMNVIGAAPKKIEDSSVLPTTLDDQIREIMRDEIEAATGGRV